jgi:peptide/nickel transport system substrate-binding protein
MFGKISTGKLANCIITLALVIPLIAGCAPAATAPPAVVQPTTAPVVQPTTAQVVPPTSAPVVQPTTPPVAPTTAPAAKKTFVFGRYMDAINPDPVMQDANADIWYIQQYYSGLLRFKPDNSLEADLAESWDISEDGLTYTFHLRPGGKFSDGSPITGADWQGTLDRCRDPKNGIWAFTMEAVDQVIASDTTVVFKLKYPYVPFLYSAALFNCVLMPQKLMADAGGWEKFMLHPVGTGPFIMKEWVKGDHMLLVRNPYYWEKGKPILDEILVKTIVDDNARILALQKGEVDAINYPPFSRIADLSKDPNLKIIQFPSTYTNYLTLNIRNAPLDKYEVREALSYAIDREALIKTVNFGVGEPATNFRPKGSLYFDPNLPGWPYDVAKAKQLLTQAGYPNGFDVTMEIVSGRVQNKQIATLVQAMWAQIGVKLTINEVESGLYNQNYYANKFQIHISGWTDDIPDPSEEVTYAMVGTNNGAFHTGYNDETVNKLAQDAVKETDPAKRQAMYYQIQEAFNNSLHLLPLWWEPYLVMTRTNVSNFEQTPLGTYIWRDLDVTK